MSVTNLCSEGGLQSLLVTSGDVNKADVGGAPVGGGVAALVILALVRVALLGVDTAVILDVLEGVVHETSVASLINESD